MRGSSRDLHFYWPFTFTFLGAAIKGGIVGSIIKRLQTKGKPGERRRFVKPVVTGGLVGIGVTVLYAIGINLLPVTPSATAGEALIFGLALVGGFLGLRIPKT